jgi:pteridine reductase
VAPGAITWPEDASWQDELARQRIINTVPLRRVGDPDDIARAVLFLVDDAPYVTGHILNVDGGRSAHL